MEVQMAGSGSPVTKPESMLPIMVVLGIMFFGICIAMNLMSRARFKKQANAFKAAGRPNAQRRTNRGYSTPGGGQRLSYCPSPIPPQNLIGSPANIYQQQRSPQHRLPGKNSFINEASELTSVAAI